MKTALFYQMRHPFVWTTPNERVDVLANANDPLWNRFLEEAERHFEQTGGLRPASFPVFCHDGDLDEVMAACVLACVRDEPRLWHWVGDWLRGALAYYREILPTWRENRYRIMRGETPLLATPGQAGSNPRQFFEGFTRGVAYWVEAGLTSVLLHLLDQIEAYAPGELSQKEKDGILEAVGDYADRYAFHEEKLKYNNRGMWSNAGVLLAGIARSDSRSGDLLRFQAARRHREFRSTFLDDGFHVEGAPDYHLMAADGLLAYLLTASHLESEGDLYAASVGEGFFERYPSFVEIVRAYLKTVIPGPVLWNHARGCSVSTPVTVRPALMQAWKLSRDPEIGWLLRERIDEVEAAGNPTPLKVTKASLLGLGHYQPLLNFWLYRPLDRTHPPRQIRQVMSGYGTVFSRSGWDKTSSCITARFGYEGTGKGHRDHAHVTVAAGGREILKDPFPRFGPPGLESAMFHNTVVLDGQEPTAVVGRIESEAVAEGADAFLITNAGGEEPDRIFLHDPCEETNYWFSTHPCQPDFAFQRAVIHVHNRCAILVDSVTAERKRQIDWFFHSGLMLKGYDQEAAPRTTIYQCSQRQRVVPAKSLEMQFRGEIRKADCGEWTSWNFQQDSLEAVFRAMSPDAAMEFETGHHVHQENSHLGGGAYQGESDYYLRARAQAQGARVLWVVSWGGPPVGLEVKVEKDAVQLQIREEAKVWHAKVDFMAGAIELHKCSDSLKP